MQEFDQVRRAHRPGEGVTLQRIAAELAQRAVPLERRDYAEITKALEGLGSSIHEVYQDTHPQLREVVATAIQVRDDALAALTGAGTDTFAISNPDINPRPLTGLLPEGAETGVLPAQPVEDGGRQRVLRIALDGDGGPAVATSAPISAAITAAICAVSTTWASTFCP